MKQVQVKNLKGEIVEIIKVKKSASMFMWEGDVHLRTR